MKDGSARCMHVLRGALVAALACGGPLPGSAGAGSAGAGSAGGETDGANAAGASIPDGGGTALVAVHAMTILSCSAAGECGKPDATDSLTRKSDGGYRVATGSGTGVERSREQALSDIYRELRDRTGFGTKLVAVSHHDAHPGSTPSSGQPAKSTGTGGSDPLILASFEILDAVDREGRVTLDVFHGRTSCKVALSVGESEAGARRCLVDGPEHGSSHEDPVTPREREKRFGM